jgi:hypothetical protein
MFWHNVRMRDEHAFTLRQADQARTDIAAIESEPEVIQAQLARLPTRRELAQTVLLATLTGGALVLVGIEALFR